MATAPHKAVIFPSQYEIRAALQDNPELLKVRRYAQLNGVVYCGPSLAWIHRAYCHDTGREWWEIQPRDLVAANVGHARGLRLNVPVRFQEGW